MGEKKYYSSEELIKAKLGTFTQDSKYIAPFNESNFSEKKLLNACKYSDGVDPMTVVGFTDSTLLGSAKEGMLFTGTVMYYKGSFEAPIKIVYEEIEDAIYEEYEKEVSKGTRTTEAKVIVKYKDGKSVTIKQYGLERNQFLADLLHGIVFDVETIDSTEQLVRLNDLGDEVISIYLKIVMNYLKEDDGIIDCKEYKELIGLMTRLNIKKGMSDELRMYRLEAGISEQTEKLLSEFEEMIPNGSRETIYQSLTNDLLLIRKEIIDNWKNSADFLKYKTMLGVSDEQVDFFVRKMKQDEAIINEKIDDNTIKKTANELIAVGGAAGVSLAALTVTGGVSTGVWGGLLTLGMASTGGMLIGLAAVAGVGYASYRGLKYLSGTSELEKYGIRMSMLQEKIKQMQISQNYLIEDINWTSEKLASLLVEKDKIIENFEKIQSLLKLNHNLKESSEIIAREENQNTYEILKAQVPSVLNEEKCNELLMKTRYEKQFKEFIYSYYVKNENGQYQISDSIETNILEKLVQVFEQIGYYDTTKSLAAQGSMLKKKGVDALKGFLE